jgi:hypothetical protein
MRPAVDWEAAIVAFQHLQVRDQPVGQPRREGHVFGGDLLPVCGGVVFHAQEGRASLALGHRAISL